MKTICIVEGNTPEIVATGDAGSAGFVRTLLAIEPNIRLRVEAPYGGSLSADVFEGVDGVIFSGSGTSWAVTAPEAAPQREVMEWAFSASRPVWGSCNGMQLATVVLGGDVRENPAGREVGLARDLKVTAEGAAHEMMLGRSELFAVPTVHRDEVNRAPDGAVVTATNAECQIQAMVIEEGGVDFWGTQYHPELNPVDIAAYIRAEGGIFGDQAHLIADLEVAERDSAAAARLGTTTAGLAVPTRANELRNWLDHL